MTGGNTFIIIYYRVRMKLQIITILRIFLISIEYYYNRNFLNFKERYVSINI